MKSMKTMISGLFMAVLLSACGNQQRYADYLYSTTGGMPDAEATAYMSESLQCSETPNVLSPSGKEDYEYRGCKKSQAGSLLRLYPATGALHTVCVFPTQAGRGIITNPYASITNRFAVQCANVGESGTDFNFGNLPYNGAIVVRAANAAVMAYCLAYGNVASCASQSSIEYSTGSF
jgi:hypothetical protein